MIKNLNGKLFAVLCHAKKTGIARIRYLTQLLCEMTYFIDRYNCYDIRIIF